MESSFWTMAIFQAYVAPAIISLVLVYFRTTNDVASKNLAVQLVFQLLQSIMAMMTLFCSCSVHKRSEFKQKCGIAIGTYVPITNIVLGLIFAVAHIVIMASNGDLEDSKLKIWFLAYTFEQVFFALTFVLIFIIVPCLGKKSQEVD